MQEFLMNHQFYNKCLNAFIVNKLFCAFVCVFMTMQDLTFCDTFMYVTDCDDVFISWNVGHVAMITIVTFGWQYVYT